MEFILTGKWFSDCSIRSCWLAAFSFDLFALFLRLISSVKSCCALIKVLTCGLVGFVCFSFAALFRRSRYHLFVKNARKIIDVSKVADKIFDSTRTRDAVSKDALMKSLIGFHSISGCNTISSFAGRGKVKALERLLSSIEYKPSLCQSWRNNRLISRRYYNHSFICLPHIWL